ncbi:hypothetical protein PMN64_01215 [Bradyrhizobium sp. UFLA01-814]|uniref:hypothetical protein n=1 Tax=Bradyrhizobium sp. UFLA01-814 TaxID=3023480 RepID=UPI00398AA806
MERGSRFRREIARAPVAASEIDRAGKERRFVEWNIDFKLHALREGSFRKQQIAAAGAAANGEITLGNTDLRKRVGDRSGRNRLLVWRKAWRFSIWRIDHVTAEKDHRVRRSGILLCGHRDTWTNDWIIMSR